MNILREKLVHTCSKFCDCGTLLSQPYHITSPVGADVFRTFVEPLNEVSPTITNESVSGIRLLCQEFGYQDLSAAVSEFLAQHSSAGDRACRELVAFPRF